MKLITVQFEITEEYFSLISENIKTTFTDKYSLHKFISDNIKKHINDNNMNEEIKNIVVAINDSIFDESYYQNKTKGK